MPTLAPAPFPDRDSLPFPYVPGKGFWVRDEDWPVLLAALAAELAPASPPPPSGLPARTLRAA